MKVKFILIVLCGLGLISFMIIVQAGFNLLDVVSQKMQEEAVNNGY